MTRVKISLNSIEKVKHFVNLASRLDCDLDLTTGRYVVDGKSIMGIFSLDLSNPIELDINTQYDVNDVLKVIDEFIIER